MTDEHDQPRDAFPVGRPLTPAHEALITMLAEIAVRDYLAEEEQPTQRR